MKLSSFLRLALPLLPLVLGSPIQENAKDVAEVAAKRDPAEALVERQSADDDVGYSSDLPEYSSDTDGIVDDPYDSWATYDNPYNYPTYTPSPFGTPSYYDYATPTYSYYSETTTSSYYDDYSSSDSSSDSSSESSLDEGDEDSTSNSSSSSSKSSHKGLTGGAKGGIAVGVLAIVGIAGGVLAWWRKRKAREAARTAPSNI